MHNILQYEFFMMITDYNSLTVYCLAKKAATSSYPFGEGTLVFKVLGKMFALISEDTEPLRMNLKCDPERAIELREENASIIPGFHMNKIHWNTLILEGVLSDTFVLQLIDHSYELVIASLPKSKREELCLL